MLSASGALSNKPPSTVYQDIVARFSLTIPCPIFKKYISTRYLEEYLVTAFRPPLSIEPHHECRPRGQLDGLVPYHEGVELVLEVSLDPRQEEVDGTDAEGEPALCA